ncbi:DUF302 domain-containing protein [Catalinimonas sp. 4WD22]|uniref:DUF302 domain-containing protein n=1 Tax=Catalinimonas locisalis TaxID=3133978 RepID=UPI003100E291
MQYYFSKKLANTTFDQALEKVGEVLKSKGFGILTEIDVQATMKKKLDKDLRPYKILGACNPSFAYQALQAENKIGTMLPCNVIVQELEGGAIEVSAVDPMASMQAVENPALEGIAGEVQAQLKSAIEAL